MTSHLTIATLNTTLRVWHIVNIAGWAPYRLHGHRLKSVTRSPVFVKTAITHEEENIWSFLSGFLVFALGVACLALVVLLVIMIISVIKDGI